MSLQFAVTEAKLEDKAHLPPDKAEGAHISFRGYVRQDNPKKGLSGVQAIDYACYRELAEKEGMRIMESACTLYGVRRIFCLHRIGVVALGEASLHIEVSSAHRKEAFEAMQYIIDCIKESLPIWKKEITASGQAVWT